MAKKSLTVTDQGEVIVASLIKNGSIEATAQELGISERVARAYIRKPAYKEILISSYSESLLLDLAPAAIFNMKSMLNGAVKPSGPLVDLCRTILDRIGVGVPKARDPADDKAKPVESMTIAQLQAFIAEKEANLRDVTTVDAPQATVTEAQVSDLLDS
jgi:hypothetical protein